jgi:hypothetical protein
VLSLPTLQVTDRTPESVQVVFEVTEACVTGKAKHASDLTGLLIMIYMNRRSFSAAGAHAALPANQLLGLRRADSVASRQVVVPASTVQPLLRLLATGVVTRLAARMSAVSVIAVPWKLI